MPFKLMPFGGQRYNGHYADNVDFKQYFGLKPSDKWPTGALSDVEIRTTDGRVTSMWLLPRGPVKTHERYDWAKHKVVTVPIKTSKHRCMVHCPDCSVGVSAGRAHQHKCASKSKYNYTGN